MLLVIVPDATAWSGCVKDPGLSMACGSAAMDVPWFKWAKFLKVAYKTSKKAENVAEKADEVPAKKKLPTTLPTELDDAIALIKDGRRFGSAFKRDADHQAADFVVDDIAEKGKLFQGVGGDKRPFSIVQMPGESERGGGQI
ncbi:hypothetical protein [Streptomyces sp. NPDC085540]|uniref:hypothetical protein n=1 Tax=Streptomyces sp. NPDC085540 TaxID=3365730 RepID=UPI0037CE8DFF